MLGSIRFILSVTVFITHLPFPMERFNPGAVAVICFYFISGFLMHRSYKRFQQHTIRPVYSFYRDRVIKLLPQYFLVVTISFLCLAWLGTSRTIYAFSQDISLARVILNYLVLPANYVIPPFVIEPIAPQPIVATAWSLATEFHFYLILPMIFLLHRTQWTLLLLTVMAVQFSSFFFTRINFNSFNYGYYYIFGVLTVFLYGYAFAGKEIKFFRRMMFFIWGMYVSFLCLAVPVFHLWNNQVAPEVMIGGSIALPLGYFFTRVRLSSRKARCADEFLGDLAYPIFISHFLAFFLVENLLQVAPTDTWPFCILSVLLCLFLSFLLYLFQIRFEHYRIKVRGFDSLKRQSL